MPTFTEAQLLFCRCIYLAAEFLSAHWLTENIRQRRIWVLFYGWSPDLMGIRQRKGLCKWVSQMVPWLKTGWWRFWEDGGNNCGHSFLQASSAPAAKAKISVQVSGSSLSHLCSVFAPLCGPSAGQEFWWMLWGMKWEKREERRGSSCCCCDLLLFISNSCTGVCVSIWGYLCIEKTCQSTLG